MVANGIMLGKQDWLNTWKTVQCNLLCQQTKEKSDDNSVESEKALDQIPHSFFIKIVSKLGIKGSLSILIKNVYKNPTINISLIGKRRNTFFLRSEKSKMSDCTTYFKHYIGGFIQCNKARKKSHTD